MPAAPLQANEPPIDASLDHYLEERALAIALDKATTPEERERVERLAELRSALMQQREAYSKEATAKRHARGEIYSASRVAAINEMGPTQAELDDGIRALYLPQTTSEGVLKAHARTHFTQPLVFARRMLRDMPPDVAEAARRMQEHEEAFARAWTAAIGDPGFDAELREERRRALLLVRTATRPVYLVGKPACAFDDVDARELGKAWTKLDRLAESLGMRPLSEFIAFDDEHDTAGVPAGELLAIVEALLSDLAAPGRKFPSRRGAVAVLSKVRDALLALKGVEGTAHFEVDI